VRRVVVVMDHVEKSGRPKLLKTCTLPLTGRRVVDMLVTDLAVFAIDRRGGGGMTLTELASDVGLEEVRDKTEAAFAVALS
jgi:3-oxoacid CoA-transferase subunit B